MSLDNFRKATKHGDVKTAKALIKEGLDLTYRYKKGWTALHIACKAGQVEIVRALLEYRADVNAETDLWRTPLDEALHYRQPAVAEVLRESGGKRGYELSLAGAIADGNLGWVKRHLASGVDVNQKFKGELPLCLALSRCRWEVVEYLLRKKPDVKKTQGARETPLHVAVSSRADESILKALLRAGADIDAVTEYGETPLAVAAEHEDEDAVRFLLDQGANAKQDGRDSSSPLANALQNDNHDLARLLIDHGAKVTLFQAAHCGHLECARSLLRDGADVNAVETGNLQTPLLEAAQNNYCDLVELFLESKADPNAQEDMSWGADAPLHAAVNQGSARMVKMLLAHGADPDLQNGEDLSPLELAKRRNHGHLVHIMEAHLDRLFQAKTVEQLYTIHKVTELLSVDEAFVMKLLKNGKLRQLQLDPETVRIPESSLGRYLASLQK